jgi:hypothetical protein
LRQPKNPKKEPRGATGTRRSEGEGSSDLMAAMKKISDHQAGYGYGSNHGPFSAMKPTDKFDCSSSCSYALHLAGMMTGSVSLSSHSFSFGKWGEQGRGETFTVWQNDEHVFMMSEGKDKWRFDTGGPGGGKGATLHKGSSAIRPTSGFNPRHWKGQ